MVFAIWLPLLVGLSAVAGSVGSDYRSGFGLPDTESLEVSDREQSDYTALADQITALAAGINVDVSPSSTADSSFVGLDMLRPSKPTKFGAA